jgi:DNA-binding response OmpR family regulator
MNSAKAIKSLRSGESMERARNGNADPPRLVTEALAQIGPPRRRFCRRCGAEIATANLMDIDPGVDREHFSLVLQGGLRHQLSPTEWQLFTALYQRHGRIVPPAELATATRNAQRKIRAQIPRLRRSLIRSRFLLRTHHALGYELIVRVEEHSAHVA